MNGQQQGVRRQDMRLAQSTAHTVLHRLSTANGNAMVPPPHSVIVRHPDCSK